jgi:hypothetical protein
MGHYVFNFSGGDPEHAAALLDAKMWGIEDDERYGSELAPGDVALIYVAALREFIGRADLATPVHAWTSSEAQAVPDDSAGGVLLSDVERWDFAVPMQAAMARIDPTASNPLVQANATAGFQLGVVRITAGEYNTAVALGRESPET